MFLRKITIVARGDTEHALEDALDEAMRQIKDGCSAGADRTDDGAYYFDATENVPDGEIPA